MTELPSDTQPDAAPQLYTLYLDYSGTGMGILVRVMVVRAPDSEAALEQFRQIFYPVGDWSYMRQGVDVYEGVHRPLLSRWFTEHMVAGMQKNLRHNGLIYFHWSFNAS